MSSASTSIRSAGAAPGTRPPLLRLGLLLGPAAAAAPSPWPCTDSMPGGSSMPARLNISCAEPIMSSICCSACCLAARALARCRASSLMPAASSSPSGISTTSGCATGTPAGSSNGSGPPAAPPSCGG
ncbi:hypothetical protein COO60DRAFT_1513048 [Scenedesmus sp. NREL 46B-D3]|nr:hypothetical protein COO60DRAFT_1513048 [Scenedesmus sp. NREL 46B-D3]